MSAEPGVKAGERICGALRHFHERVVGVDGGKAASHWCPQLSSWNVWVYGTLHGKGIIETDRTEVSLNYLDGPATSQGRRMRKCWCLGERGKTKSTGGQGDSAQGVRWRCVAWVRAFVRLPVCLHTQNTLPYEKINEKKECVFLEILINNRHFTIFTESYYLGITFKTISQNAKEMV